MNILFITDNYPPEYNAAAIRTSEHINRWAQTNNNITVITCFPNFPKGKIFKGFKNKLYKVEKFRNIKIIRVWTFIAPNSGFFLRTLDHISFAASSIIASFFVNKPDYIFATSPQFFTMIGGYFISIFKKIPLILEIRDLWPDSLLSVGVIKKNLIFKFLKKIEYYLYKKAFKIIVVTKSTFKILENNGIKNKVSVIYNGVNLEKFQPSIKNKSLVKKYNLRNYFCIGYIGTIGLAHEIEVLISAAKKLLKKNYKIKLVIIGEGARKEFIKKKINKYQLTNVILLNSVPNNEIAKYWSILDCSITHLKNDMLFRTVIPSKVFESMAMQIPIIHGVLGESSDMIHALNIGECFESGNYKSLYGIIVKFYKDRRLLQVYKNNCSKVSNNFDRKKLADRLLKEIGNNYEK